MRAVVCEAFGGPEVLAVRDMADPPPPGAGELQVRLLARGVQYVDVLMLAGTYQFRPEPPFIPGGEAAGEVLAVGAGAEMRQSLGTTVFFGMIGVTAFGLLFTPVFYVVVRALFGRQRRHRPPPPAAEAPPPPESIPAGS